MTERASQHHDREASKISVILPVYNGAQFLKDCLNSVVKQTWQPYEVIVVDDGSTDESAVLVQSFPSVKYYYQDNAGVAAARNYGIGLAGGDWIAFIDQDDFWTEKSLENRVEMLQKKPNVDIFIGKQRWFLDGLDEKPAWVKPEQMANELDGYLLGCALIHKSLFDQFGLFDTSFRFSSDFDWFFRLRDANQPFHQVGGLVLEKRIHVLNESRHAELSLKELSRALLYSIRRKRLAN